MIAKNLYSKFISSVKWNALSSIYYQTNLTIYMFWLFHTIGPKQFGIIGTLFAIIYLCIDFLGFGFTNSLALSFKDITKDKLHFKEYYFRSLIQQMAILFAIIICIPIFYKKLDFWFSNTFSCCLLNQATWLVITGLILSESLKKNLRAISQLLFLNQALAIIEISTATLYSLSIVLIYYYTNHISILQIFLTLLIISITSVLTLATLVFLQYKKLPYLDSSSNIKNHFKPISLKKRISTQFYIYLNQLSKLSFGGNFLIFLFASTFGTTAIAPLKLINRIAVYLKYIFQYTFGLSSRNLLSRLSSKSAYDLNLNLDYKKYKELNTRFFYILTGWFLILSIALVTLELIYSGSLSFLYHKNSFLFLIVLLLESFFITHEQLLLVTNKMHIAMIPNLLTAIGIYILTYTNNLHINTILIILIILRALTFIFVEFLAKKTVEKNR